MSFFANFINHLIILGKDYHKSTAFYGQAGLFKSINRKLNPNTFLIFEDDFFSNLGVEKEFVWFIIRSERMGIGAQSFHTHVESRNSSGEHSF